MPPLRSGALRLTEPRSGIPVRSVQQIRTKQFSRVFNTVTQIEPAIGVRGIAPVHGAHLRAADFFALSWIGGNEHKLAAVGENQNFVAHDQKRRVRFVG